MMSFSPAPFDRVDFNLLLSKALILVSYQRGRGFDTNSFACRQTFNSAPPWQIVFVHEAEMENRFHCVLNIIFSPRVNVKFRVGFVLFFLCSLNQEVFCCCRGKWRREGGVSSFSFSARLCLCVFLRPDVDQIKGGRLRTVGWGCT